MEFESDIRREPEAFGRNQCGGGDAQARRLQFGLLRRQSCSGNDVD